MGHRRGEVEIEAFLKGYRDSGMTRGEYCRRRGIGGSTLDYYRRREAKGQRLVRVNLETPEPDLGFVLVLGNGRRIESNWKFGETELA